MVLLVTTVSLVKYSRGNVKFAGGYSRTNGSIQYKRKTTFVEIISLKKTPQNNNFCVKGHFFLHNSGWKHSVSNTENVLGRQ